ncbi:DNA translocase FtsK [Roseiterribacter gracilis]|uniref:DNA translocase FtsK n=1 Tax=Roseiterribacter gracilis TaxID=2812848 RepID=A0A8S8XIS4_9PROT|nr:DNA translocase FtsK [Rhodospirillales bacterium TMPK1]
MATTRTRTGYTPPERRTLLPDAARETIKRRTIEFGGVALIGVGALLLVALLTYNPRDPSWNAAVPIGQGARNALGVFGAYFADLFLQTLGVAAGLIPLTLAAWGWRVVRHKPIGRWWLRGIASLLLFLCVSAALGAVPNGLFAPLGRTLGGSVGILLLGAVERSGVDAALAAFLFALIAAGLLAASLGASMQEWREGLAQAGRTLKWMGAWVVFGLHRAVGALASLLVRAPREQVEAPTVQAPRAAPVLERAAPSFEAAHEVAAAPIVATRTQPAVIAPRIEPQKPKKPVAPPKRQTALDLPSPDSYQLPSLELLQKGSESDRSPGLSETALQKNAELLTSVLQDFGVKGEIVKIHPGPVVTLYELEPAPGTKSSRVIGLADDIARSMSAVSVRVAVVPGRNVIGIELPNAKRETVLMRELLELDDTTGHKLALHLGKDIGGQPIVADLTRMPHLLVAGTTGSGKSVAVNTMILSLLYALPPEKCRFIMIDPKMLELSVYDNIPHLLAPVVTDPKKAVVALKWTVREMEDRYRAMSKLGVRNIDGYNARLREARDSGEMLLRKVQTGFDPDTGKPIFEDQPIDLTELPFIVVIVDEFADLMLVAGKDIEAAIQRLAQMARAAGIHLIMATQRPSVDVITGTIKANFPTRISFQVTSKIDSRTILGESGAEQLLGQGDMLYMAAGGRITRVHGPFVRDQEVEKIVQFLKAQGEPDYVEAVTEEDDEMAMALGEEGAEGGGSGDALYDQAVALVAREKKASTSFIQRHLQIGYNRAARLIEKMEKEGVVSSANHVGKREVLISHHG